MSTYRLLCSVVALFVLSAVTSAQVPTEPAPLPVLTEETFAKFVGNAKRPVVVKFTAGWCGPCRQMAPIMHELQKSYQGRITVLEVDFDTAPKLASFLQVTALPTTVIIDKRVVQERLVGFKTKKEVEEAVNKVLSAATAPLPAVASK